MHRTHGRGRTSCCPALAGGRPGHSAVDPLLGLVAHRRPDLLLGGLASGVQAASLDGGGCGVLGVGCWVLGVGCGVLGVGCWVLGVGCWVLGVGCGVWGVGCGVLGVGCWVLGVGCWVLGVGMSGVGCRMDIRPS